MPKIHARMSVEIEVTEAEFRKIVQGSREDHDECHYDVDLCDWMITRAKPCDWDSGGYIPSQWLQEDMEYERDCNKVEV